MRGLVKMVMVLTWVVLLPTAASAQATIAGVVRDSSGAILPGVTVEASSPALIEKVRSAATDGTGQYRIVDLRAGTYTVTFTLAGFNTIKRDEVELSGSMVVTLNADMKVGAVSETITVTGESPVVDLQSVRRQTTMTSEVLTSIPSARAYGAIMLLIPAMTTQAGGAPTDVQARPGMTVFGGQGGRNNEGRLQVDGLNVGASRNGGGVSGFNTDITNAQEVVFTTSGGLGEMEVGGPTIQVVPKVGGNTIKGSVYLAGTTAGMVGSNYTTELQAAGLASPAKHVKLWDYTAGLGGPIKKDRLWFFGQFRTEGGERTTPGIFANKNAGDQSKWLVDLDPTRPSRGASSWVVGSLRLTAQATPRNKFNVYWDEQRPCSGATYGPNVDGCRTPPESGYSYASPFFGRQITPEADGYLHRFQRVQQATFTSTVTNKLLLEAGLGTYLSRWGSNTKPGSPVRDFIRVTEACSTAAGCAANGGFPGLTYRSQEWFDDWIGAHTWRAAASYVTGAHSMKAGYQGAFYVDDELHGGNNFNLSYRVQNGVPDQLTQDLYYSMRKFRTRSDALYAQELWTMGRVSLQGAIRYDYARSHFPEQQVGPTRFLPTPFVFPETEGVNGWKDITPRGGVAYDVFGNGKTSVKVNVGKYLEAASNDGLYIATNPTSRIAGSSALGAPAITRPWSDANGNWVPDCDLMAVGANGECGPISNRLFGTTVMVNNFDPSALQGWGIRPSDWQVGVSVQHEVLPGVSVEGGYYRRWLNNFFVFGNVLTTPSDYGSFSITAPTDSRLPSGGGYPIASLYDVNPNKFGQISNLMFRTDDLPGSPNEYSHYNGFLMSMNARPRNGLSFQAGFNAGKTVQDVCAVRALLPELLLAGALVPVAPGVSPTNPYCHTDPGFVVRVTGLTAYTIPKIDVLVSGTFRSDQGAILNANYAATNAVVSPSLGRNISSGAPFLSIPLLKPGERWGDRVNEIDLRIAKVLRFGRTRTHVGVDIYNLTNSNAILNYNQNFNPNIKSGPGAWLQPLGILSPRFARVNAQFDF